MLLLERVLKGEYTIVFDDVSGYITPLSQTKTLDQGKTIVFEGVYQQIPKS